VAPLSVDVENWTSLDHDMCAAFAIRARKVAWPANLLNASGYTIRMSLTHSEVRRRRDDIRFDCRVSMELTINGQLLAKTGDRAAAMIGRIAHVAGDAPIDEVAQSCIEAEVEILLGRVVPTLSGHMASTGASHPNAPQPNAPVAPQARPTP
jgi:hypothetical protein